MVTPVGLETDENALLLGLIQLNYDAAEALGPAAERVADPEARALLADARTAWLRRVGALAAQAERRRLRGTAGGRFTLSQGSGALGAAAGDAALLEAVRGTVRDVIAAHERVADAVDRRALLGHVVRRARDADRALLARLDAAIAGRRAHPQPPEALTIDPAHGTRHPLPEGGRAALGIPGARFAMPRDFGVPGAAALDLNTAPVEAIAALPMVGPFRALDLVAARPLGGWDDLRRVPGFDGALADALAGAGMTIGRGR